MAKGRALRFLLQLRSSPANFFFFGGGGKGEGKGGEGGRGRKGEGGEGGRGGGADTSAEVFFRDPYILNPKP